MRRTTAAATALVAALMGVGLVTGVAEARPANDRFGRAVRIAALPFIDRVDLTGSTRANDDPQCGNSRNSVWYRYTPSADQRLIVAARSRAFEVVSVWTGSRGALTKVLCEYNDSPVFDARAGETYHIMLSGIGRRSEGKVRFKLRVAPPPPQVDFDIDPQGTINQQTHQITIGGSLSCSARYVEYELLVYQPDGRRFVTASHYEGIDGSDCDGSTMTFSNTMLGDGIFVEGGANVLVHGYAYNRFESIEFDEVIPITLDFSQPGT